MSGLKKPIFFPLPVSIFCSCSCSYNILFYPFTFILSFRNYISLNDIYKLFDINIGEEKLKKTPSQQTFHLFRIALLFHCLTSFFSSVLDTQIRLSYLNQCPILGTLSDSLDNLPLGQGLRIIQDGTTLPDCLRPENTLLLHVCYTR